MSGNEVWVTGFSEMKGEGLVDASSGATALGDLASTLSVSTADPSRYPYRKVLKVHIV